MRISTSLSQRNTGGREDKQQCRKTPALSLPEKETYKNQARDVPFNAD